MKVTVDRKDCIGCGLGCGICGNVFRLGEDGKAFVAAPPQNAAEEAGVNEAAASCPAGVIRAE